jgi:hypothetical protein
LRANDLILPEPATAAMLADVTRFGGKSVETGGFLLAPRDEDTIAIVALAGAAGIVRRRRMFQVSEIALDRLFAHADRRELWIPAQFHSHGGAAFMSPTDIAHGLSVEGFVTTILPDFASPRQPIAMGLVALRRGVDADRAATPGRGARLGHHLRRGRRPWRLNTRGRSASPRARRAVARASSSARSRRLASSSARTRACPAHC